MQRNSDARGLPRGSCSRPCSLPRGEEAPWHLPRLRLTETRGGTMSHAARGLLHAHVTAARSGAGVVSGWPAALPVLCAHRPVVSRPWRFVLQVRRSSFMRRKHLQPKSFRRDHCRDEMPPPLPRSRHRPLSLSRAPRGSCVSTLTGSQRPAAGPGLSPRTRHVQGQGWKHAALPSCPSSGTESFQGSIPLR